MQNPNHPVWLHRLLAPLIRLVLRHQPAQARPVSPKIPELALLLCLLLGWAGVHRWYLGRPLSGILQGLTLGGVLVWWWLDLVRLGYGGLHDGQNRLVNQWRLFQADDSTED